MLDPYEFNIYANIYHRKLSINNGPCDNWQLLWKTFHSSGESITECDISDARNSTAAYVMM